jgi:hypothetical protein
MPDKRGAAHGEADYRAVMEMSRSLAEGRTVRLPEDIEALVGRAWIR